MCLLPLLGLLERLTACTMHSTPKQQPTMLNWQALVL
jgi:hypothetical protein